MNDVCGNKQQMREDRNREMFSEFVIFALVALVGLTSIIGDPTNDNKVALGAFLFFFSGFIALATLSGLFWSLASQWLRRQWGR